MKLIRWIPAQFFMRAGLIIEVNLRLLVSRFRILGDLIRVLSTQHDGAGKQKC